MAVIPPPQHRATRLGVINGDTLHSCTARLACRDGYKLTHSGLTSCTLHSLIAWDWWGDQWPIPVRPLERILIHTRLQGYVQRRLPKLSGPNITFSNVTSQEKRFLFKLSIWKISLRPRDSWLWSILCNPLVSFIMWCVCVFVHIWICLQCDSSVFSLAKRKGLTPSLQSDDVAGCDALPWQQVCVVNDSWTAGVCMTWLAFKPTLLWHYLSTPSL